MAGKDSLSLTRALLAIATAKAYLEDVIVDFPGMKRRIDNWIGKLGFINLDAISIMTPESRECYRREITHGDPMQFEHIFSLLAEMDYKQRSLIEKAAEGILKGQIEIIET